MEALATPSDVSYDAQEAAIREAFPYRRPPEAVLAGTCRIYNTLLTMPHAFHQTTTAVLMEQNSRTAYRDMLLLPAIALDEPWGPFNFNLSGLATGMMPRVTTLTIDRPWGVWCRQTPLEQPANPPYTPDRDRDLQFMLWRTKELYKDIRRDRTLPDWRRKNLQAHLGCIPLRAFWYDEYFQKLPDDLMSPDRDRREAADEEVERLFVDIPRALERMSANYLTLGTEDRKLLEAGYDITFELDLSGMPAYYLNDVPLNPIDRLLGYEGPLRTPWKLCAVPEGIPAYRVLAVWLDNEFYADHDLDELVRDRLIERGISPDRIDYRAHLQAPTLTDCLYAYHDKDTREPYFNRKDMLRELAYGGLKPLLPTALSPAVLEWAGVRR